MKVEIKGLGVLETEPKVLNHIAAAFFAAAMKYEVVGCPSLSADTKQIANAIHKELDKIGYYNDQRKKS